VVGIKTKGIGKFERILIIKRAGLAIVKSYKVEGKLLVTFRTM
jgi:hypothetical protein